MWTKFWDMHSGGSTKEGNYEEIYIEASEDEAAVIFYNRFGHSPYRVSCTCCGDDYSIDEGETLEQLSAYHRDCRHDGKKYVEEGDPKRTWTKYITLEKYIAKEDVLVIYAKDIKDEERRGSVPTQGYVYM